MPDPNTPNDPLVPERPAVSDTPSASAITDTVAAGTDTAGGQVDELIGIELIDDPTNQRILREAGAFLASPGGRSLLEITDQVTDLVAVEAYYMGELPPLVENMCVRMNALRRQHCIDGARAELRQPAPDLLTLLDWVREASSQGSMTPAAAREEIAELRRQIDELNLRDPIYEQMLALVALLEEARPHLTNRDSIAAITRNTVPSLRDGHALSFVTVLQHASSMMSDPGKSGAESKGVLTRIAAQIPGLVSQIQAGLRERRSAQ